jgi:hypothetical protein
LGEPDAPSAPSITRASSSMVSLAWSAPYDHASPITNYSVTLASNVGLRWDRSVCQAQLAAFTFSVFSTILHAYSLLMCLYSGSSMSRRLI